MWEFQKQFTLLYPQHWPCLGKSSDRVAVTSMSQSGLNYMVPVKQKITCIPSPQDSFGVGHSYSTFVKAWMIHTPVQPQEVFGPFLASSVHGQSNHMWLRVWHSHLGSGGKSNIWWKGKLLCHARHVPGTGTKIGASSHYLLLQFSWLQQQVQQSVCKPSNAEQFITRTYCYGKTSSNSS